jgi:2-polyprenyl-6-methoxyphenol hydroxylase-like FAD-dependent oxidoreductase
MHEHVNIIGAGPVGLVAALRMATATNWPIVLYAPPSVNHTDKPRAVVHQATETEMAGSRADSVESIPASLLGLLVELGIHPASIGVDQLHDTRHVAWESACPESNRGSHTAHIERPYLEQALMRKALEHPNIKVVRVAFHTVQQLLPGMQGILMDATGRRARTACSRQILAGSPVARTWTVCATLPTEERTFRIAALPDGYVYRLATAHTVLMGWCGSPGLLRLPRAEWNSYLRKHDANWLGSAFVVSANQQCRAGKAGYAGAQWANTRDGYTLLGDAAYARDALCSQGLAVGISDALYAVAAVRGGQYALWNGHRQAQFLSHLLHLEQVIKKCRHRHTSFWSRYAESIEREIAVFTSSCHFATTELRDGKLMFFPLASLGR